ncbi:MAG: transcription antitermination factor NusB [Saprospiraceae bacterium]|nr:transcription antitermination factor NusB [Saprospiraceae bacterium]
MLSRRNVRIKVMQLLYAKSRDNDLKFKDILTQYQRSVNETFSIYIFNIAYFLKVTEYSVSDAQRRASKLLPTSEDKDFKPLLFNNSFTQSLYKNIYVQKLITTHKMNDWIDIDNVKKFYSDFSKTVTYLDFINNKDKTDDSYREILLELYRYLSKNKLYNELMDDRFQSWADDESIVVGTMKKTLKSLPVEQDFYKQYLPSVETTQEFGETLLKDTFNRDEELMTYIEPTLRNWDADRVAIIDMILIKMALIEMIICTTIPTKVTLNEYVDIAKLYSTDKSKEFINGVLDKLMNQLKVEGKIVKEGRGLIE